MNMMQTSFPPFWVAFEKDLQGEVDVKSIKFITPISPS